GGNPRVSQNKKSATSDSAIRRGRAAGHVIMNRRGQWQTLRAIKISFDSARTRARGRVEMNADKNRVSIRVGDGDAGTERNKDVAVSRHYNAITVRLKDRFQSLRNVQGHCFFRNTLPRNSAAVVSAVAGIDDHGCRRTLAFGCNHGASCSYNWSGSWPRREGAPLSRIQRAGRGQSVSAVRNHERSSEEQKVFEHRLIVLGCVGRSRRKFRSVVARCLRHSCVDHSAGNSYHTILGMDKTRPGLVFGEAGPGNQFAIETDPGVGPGSGSGAIKNMKLIRSIELGLGLI